MAFEMLSCLSYMGSFTVAAHQVDFAHVEIRSQQTFPLCKKLIDMYIDNLPFTLGHDPNVWHVYGMW
uniref:Uncharacterized protein n=1 Tax=Salix viminalis TaxID=40686 RepID=A0A6N2MDX2_SALVM